MQRERITITLQPGIVDLLDRVVDGQKIRNRSHAVEVLLSQTLIPKSTQVLILAGGKGVNFRPLTFEMPKAMIPLGGKPLLEHTLDRLKRCGLLNVSISLGHLGNQIKEYFGDGNRFGLHITYIEQKGTTGGTAQALRQAQGYFKQEPFLLLYADVVADVDYTKFVEFHRSQKNVMVTMALASEENVCDWGVARMSGSTITSFEEKPKKPSTKSHLVNAGMYVVDPQFFDYISQADKRLESDVLPRLAEEGRLSGFPLDGLWYDIATPEIYAKAIKDKELIH